MRIDRNLNIVLSFEIDDEKVISHTKPIPSVVYDSNFRLFRAVYDDFASGGSVAASVSIAKTIFNDVASQMGKSDNAREVLNMIANMTSVCIGGVITPLRDVKDEDIASEVENKLLFFIVYSRHLLASQMRDWAKLSEEVLGITYTAQTAQEVCTPSSSQVTDSQSSLTTSTTEEPITAKPAKRTSLPT